MKRVNPTLFDSMTLDCGRHPCRSNLHQATLCTQDPNCLASWAPRSGGEDCLMCKCPSQLPNTITTGALAEFLVIANGDDLPGNRQCIWSSLNHLPLENDRLIADDIFKCIFVNEKFCILIRFSAKFVGNGPIRHNQVLVHVMAWRRAGESHHLNQCWSSSSTHIWVTKGRWVIWRQWALVWQWDIQLKCFQKV